MIAIVVVFVAATAGGTATAAGIYVPDSSRIARAIVTEQGGEVASDSTAKPKIGTWLTDANVLSLLAAINRTQIQAADVLLYRATHVPVGEDQKQHIELARDIALKFDNDYQTELFVPPEPYIGGGTAARVMSLRDGKSKMSKSDPSEMTRIHLTDSDDEIAQKIRKAKTDPEPLPDDPAGLEARPEAKNLVGIMAALQDRSIEAVLADHAGQGFGQFKPALAEALIAMIGPLRSRLEQLRAEPDELDRILDAGAARARELAAPTLAKAYKVVGLSR